MIGLTNPRNLPLPPNNSLLPWVNKFGRNPEVDAGNVADVWDGGDATGGVQDYPWPAAAAATTVVSTSAADTAAGTGARTVEVQGLGAGYAPCAHTIILEGATPVPVPTDMLRVFRVKVLTAGSGGTNAGEIHVKHTAVILAQITIGFGQTLMALYTTPANHPMYLASWHGSIRHTATGAMSFRLDVRPFGGVWNVKETLELGGNVGEQFHKVWQGWQRIEPKSDIRVRVFGGTDNNSIVSAGFDLLRDY